MYQNSYVFCKDLLVPEGCGGEILPDENGKMSGFIESPNYGHAYFPNLDCTWILNGSRLITGDGSDLSKDATKIKLEFLDFDVATTVTQYARSLTLMLKPTSINSCLGDYVSVARKFDVCLKNIFL